MEDKAISQVLKKFLSEHSLNDFFANTALKWFVPFLNENITPQLGADKTVFIGVNGSQGSGKSTFCALLSQLVNELSPYSSISISLDDFYLSKAKRADLAKNIHGLLSTRGVPGTHDTQTMQSVFSALNQGLDCTIPRFDKSTDNPHILEHFTKITQRVNLVFFEGWCWGVDAQSPSELIKPINALEETKDAFGLWREFVNKKLTDDYQPLYSYFKHWVMLKAPSFDCVYDWRCEQEHKLKQKFSDASGVMSDEEIKYFISHYERLTNKLLINPPVRFDTIFELDKDRYIQGVNS